MPLEKVVNRIEIVALLLVGPQPREVPQVKTRALAHPETPPPNPEGQGKTEEAGHSSLVGGSFKN